MPIIKNTVAEPTRGYEGGYGPSQDVSKEIWKNTISLRANNEFAVFDFLVECDQGDASYYHPIPSKSAAGKDFTRHAYCSEKNVSIDGRLVEEDCLSCKAVISEEHKNMYPRLRYLYWAFHYGTYHLETNPDLQSQKPWTQSWKPVTIGKQTLYRESVLKPQLLVLSQKTWSSVERIDQRKGTILSTPDAPAHFEFRRNFQNSTSGGRGMVGYDLMPSDISVPDFSEKVSEIIDTLPKLDHIAAELVTELDLPEFGAPSIVKEQEDAVDAFEHMANMKEDGTF